MKKWVTIVSVIMVVIVIFLGVEVWLFLNTVPTQEKQEKIVTIERGAPFIRIARHLRQEQVITNEIKFYFLARWKGNLEKIKAGEYLLDTGSRPADVLATLVSGRTYLHRLTVPEGYNMYQIADLAAQKGLASREAFLKTATDKAFLESIGISNMSVEGYLFPESYFFSKPVTSEKIIQTMVEKFHLNYTKDMVERALKLKLTREQVVTLASIIEKETGVPDERPLISAVFHNRLKNKMKLQSDPTVIYGIYETFAGNLTRKHLLTPGPYNTYMKLGFPKGPIANPGRESLEAAVNPAPVPYLFFVSQNDGSHYFSTTYRDHVNAVNRFQKQLWRPSK